MSTAAKTTNTEEPFSPSWQPTQKWIASAIVGVVVYLLTKFGLHLDPMIEQAINVVAILAAGYIVKNKPTLLGTGVKPKSRSSWSGTEG
jgi:hypothetical protein